MTFAELATTLLITATPIDGTVIDKNSLKVEIQQSLQAEINVLTVESLITPSLAINLDKQTSANEIAE